MNNLDDIFNIDNTPKDQSTNTNVVEYSPPIEEEPNDPIETDFDKARDSLHIIVKKGTKAVEELEQLASLSQNAEHYSALASMIKNVSDVSKILMGVHTEKAKVKKPSPNRIENHLHVSASTMEIARMLKGEKLEEN